MNRTHKSKKVPFSFVLDHLYPLDPLIKPMFGCYGIYIGKKMVLILRQRKSHPSINGVWIATKKEHHESLKKLFPSMKSIHVLGKGVTNWQVISEKVEDFESSVLLACEMIVKGDKRIGTVPKSKPKVKIKK